MSLFVCPAHGLHHGPFCCAEPQQWWDGTFIEKEKPVFVSEMIAGDIQAAAKLGQKS